MGTSFSTRLIGGLRVAAAAIVTAGGRDQRMLIAAADFVSRYSGVEITSDQIIDDALDSGLAIRLRGDLMLLAENLTDDGARSLLAGLRELACECDAHAAALDIVARCAELLAAPPTRGAWPWAR